jgi:hypothetical protein
MRVGLADRNRKQIGLTQWVPAWQQQHQTAKVRHTGDSAYCLVEVRMEALRTTGTLAGRLVPLEPQPDHGCESATDTSRTGDAMVHVERGVWSSVP